MALQGQKLEKGQQVNRMRTLLLALDGLALVGLVAFSVLAALNRDVAAYVIGQIACAVVVLVSALLLRRMGNSIKH